MRVRSFLGVLAIGVTLAALGCNSGQSGSNETTTTTGTGTSDAKKLRIAVIPKGTTHEFWKSIHAGAEAAAKELGNVEVIWKGPQKESDRDDQIKVVEDFITQKVDGIVLAPLDDSALRTPVSDAIAAGIPVVIIDSGLKDVKTTSFVATDNYAGGKKGGEEMVRLLGSDGPKKVILLRYQEGSASTMEREQGYLDALKAAPNITVISQEQYAGATTETAMAAAENLLQRFKDFDGVLCPNESSTSGMLRALQDAGLAGKKKFIGFDATEKLVDALKKGEINGLMVQNPYNMGYLGVKTMVSHLKKDTVDERIDTGVTLATTTNLAEPDVAKVLSPPKL